ncbi:hypothetical protein [Arthrobacter sp. M4]|uniref:hypothetical protein n=1 Tax=Arthrobacter sp. M4 TaxID=218160 RepID=UPI001CDCC81D|nr:hypothetical protein [Arthrobacter sp. M4]MCA4132620.1 hypothetical protein [Arthrobacter sp. M4]
MIGLTQLEKSFPHCWTSGEPESIPLTKQVLQLDPPDLYEPGPGPLLSGTFWWQSNPTVRSVDDARQFLKWVQVIRELTTSVIRETASTFRMAGAERKPD